MHIYIMVLYIYQWQIKEGTEHSFWRRPLEVRQVRGKSKWIYNKIGLCYNNYYLTHAYTHHGVIYISTAYKGSDCEKWQGPAG